MARIDLRNVCVDFPVYNINTRSFKKQFLRIATGGNVFKDANQHMVVRSLNDVTLSFQQGDRIGLIGHNGSGKTTLLRLLANIYEPTHGEMAINGKVSAMLNLTQGIETEFTGYENIMMRGVILGYSRHDIKHQIDEIARLTGLGDYLSMPVRTYSSGMLVRLAFAISSSLRPDILLIDEVFAAGDADFMQTARIRMVSLLNHSNIVVIANHADNIIKEFCNKALLLESGRIKYFGTVDQALHIYHGLA